MANLAISMMLLMPLHVVAVNSVDDAKVDAGKVETPWQFMYNTLTQKEFSDKQYPQLISDLLEILKIPANRFLKETRAELMLLDRAAKIDPNLCDMELAYKLLELVRKSRPSLKRYLKSRVLLQLNACIDEESEYLRYLSDNSNGRYKSIEDLLMELHKSVPIRLSSRGDRLYSSELDTAITKYVIKSMQNKGLPIPPENKNWSADEYMESLQDKCHDWVDFTKTLEKYVDIVQNHPDLYSNEPLAEEQERWLDYVHMCKAIFTMKAPKQRTIKKVQEELIKNREKEAAVSTNEVQIKETSVSE